MKNDEKLMIEVISALTELIDTAFNAEDIAALEQVEVIFSHRFMRQPGLHRAKQDFGIKLYERKLRLQV